MDATGFFEGIGTSGERASKDVRKETGDVDEHQRKTFGFELRAFS